MYIGEFRQKTASQLMVDFENMTFGGYSAAIIAVGWSKNIRKLLFESCTVHCNPKEERA